MDEMREKGKRRIWEDTEGKGDVEGKAFAGPMSNCFLYAPEASLRMSHDREGLLDA